MMGYDGRIHLFDFEVRHIAGRKHSGPDGLSRRPSGEEGNDSDNDNDSVEECVDADLDINLVEEIRDNSCGNLLRRRGGAKPTQPWPTSTLPRNPAPAFVAKESHVNLLRRRGGVTITQTSDLQLQIMHFLQTLQLPAGVPSAKEQYFRMEATNTSSKMECYFAAIRPTNRLKE